MQNDKDSKSFIVDQETAAKIYAGNMEAWEQIEERFIAFLDKTLGRMLASGFQEFHLADIRQNILIKFLPACQAWRKLADGSSTLPQFKSYIKVICNSQIADFIGKNARYYKHFPSITAGGTESDGEEQGNPLELFGKNDEPPGFETRESMEHIGRKVIPLWRECLEKQSGRNDVFAMALLFGRFFVLKNSIVKEFTKVQPETGKKHAELLIPWTHEDGELSLIRNTPPYLRDIWKELVFRARDMEANLDSYLLAESAGIQRNDLDQKISRMRKKLTSAIHSMNPTPPFVSEALALVNCDLSADSEVTA